MAKWLTIVTVVIAVLWSGWWIFGSQAAQRGVQAGIEAARSEGWRIAYDDLSLKGFPSRFDTTVTAPDVTTPDGALRWSAPFLQVFALAYRPNHLIAVAPNEMTVEIPGDAIDIATADLRGSIVMSVGTQPVLDRTTITAQALRVAMADLWVEIETGQFASRQAGGATAHDVALSLAEIALAPAVRDTVDPSNQLPDRIDGLVLEARVDLTEAIRAGRQPSVETVALRRAEVIWGETRLNLTGEVMVNSAGRPDGTLTLSMRNWAPLIAAAVAQGALTRGEAAILTAGIGGLVDADGVAQVPVTVAAGKVSVLGLPVAVLPEL